MAESMHSAAPALDDSSLFLAWDRLRRPVWMFDPAASKGVYANTSALALWGSDTLEALLARDFSNLSPAVKARTARLVQVTADGETVSERWTFYPNGQPVTVKATISTFVLADDRPVLLFEAAPIEVGAAERRAVEALRYAPTLISLFDQEGGALFCNPAAFSAYGSETLAYAERFVRPEAVESLRTRALEGHSAFDVCEIRTAQGIRWHHLVLTAVPDPVTGEIGLLLSEQDVTARVEAEQARAAAEQKAAMAEARQQFLSDMSHELRTPLNAIMGFSDIMRSRMFGPLSDRYGEYAELVHESGRHLLDLINDVLDMSKIEAERFDLQRGVFDAREAVTAAMRLLRVQADGAGVQLRGVLPPNELEVDADRRALKQIVLNLVSNALKFTPRGGQVTVTADGHDGVLEVVVADTGVGISPEDLERIGRPYEQAGGVDQRAQGTGLGLSLVRAFATLHGGEMVIESRLGAGTSVSVRMPVLTAPPRLIAEPPVAPEAQDEPVEPAPALPDNVIPFNPHQGRAG